MRSLYRVTLEMPEMDSTGQRAPIRVSLTSSRQKELLIGQVLRDTRSYYRKEIAASPPRDGAMRNLLNKGLFIRFRFARTRHEAERF